MRLKADLALLIVSLFWGSAFVAQRVAGQLGSVYLEERLTGTQLMGCLLIFVAVLLSQFKEWNLQGKIDRTHLVEGR